MSLRGKKWLFVIVVLVLLALCVSMFKKSKGQPNIILISIDSLRADRLHCYGYERDVSPNIDAFAKDSAQFTHGYSQATWTYPSHASMLTGLFPPQHGLVSEKRRVPAELDTIMKSLKDRGYTTIGVTDGGWMGSHFEWQQHFDYFDEHKRFEDWDNKNGSNPGIFQERVDAFLEIQGQVSEPFFAFIHTYEVHDWLYNDDRNEIYVDPEYRGPLFRDPFNMCMGLIDKKIIPDTADFKYSKARYDAAIFNMDKAFGVLIDSLKSKGLYERSIIILTSDHGEAFGEKGLFGHGRKPYNVQNRIPLLVRDGKRKGVYDHPVALSDIPTTIADRVRADGKHPGRNLFDTESRPVMTDTGSGAALALGELKYIFFGDRTLAYRLDDLNEKENLLAPDIVVEKPLPEEARKELKALGYLR